MPQRDESLTERQYTELRTYEHGLPAWQNARGKTFQTLVFKGYLRATDRTGGEFYEITEVGRAVLAAFRERHGLPVGV